MHYRTRTHATRERKKEEKYNVKQETLKSMML
jgi:hypothetical protein